MTIEERKKQFYDELVPFVEIYGKKMMREFYDYWTAINPNGRKMLFEKQRTKGVFQVSGRLRTWKKNSKQWKKTINIEVESEEVKSKLEQYG